MQSYYVIINNQKIYVDEDTYRAFMRPIWRESKYERRHHVKIKSLDQIQSIAVEQKNHVFTGDVEEEVLHSLMIQTLMCALDTLDERERKVIHYRYDKNMSQREAAERIGMAQTTLSYCEKRIIKKLRVFLENNF